MKNKKDDILCFLEIKFKVSGFYFLKKSKIYDAYQNWYASYEFVLLYNNHLRFFKSSSMDLAACLPAPIARITVAAPVTASPPA